MSEMLHGIIKLHNAVRRIREPSTTALFQTSQDHLSKRTPVLKSELEIGVERLFFELVTVDILHPKGNW